MDTNEFPFKYYTTFNDGERIIYAGIRTVLPAKFDKPARLAAVPLIVQEDIVDMPEVMEPDDRNIMFPPVHAIGLRTSTKQYMRYCVYSSLTACWHDSRQFIRDEVACACEKRGIQTEPRPYTEPYFNGACRYSDHVVIHQDAIVGKWLMTKEPPGEYDIYPVDTPWNNVLILNK